MGLMDGALGGIVHFPDARVQKRWSIFQPVRQEQKYHLLERRSLKRRAGDVLSSVVTSRSNTTVEVLCNFLA